MVATALHVRLYPTQDDFVSDTSRYTAFIGGRNSGKTYSGSVKALLRATQGGLGLIAAPNFPMLEHGAKRQFLERLDETGVRYDKNDQKGILRIPDWNTEVLFVTLESESRVRGPNADWAWPDEFEYVTDRGIWKALKGAVRAGDNPQLFGTSTPKGRRIAWDEWVVGKTKHHALYKATTFDNPFIDAEDYVTGLGYDGVFYEQEITADFVSFEGLVYPAFSRDTHVQSVDTEGWSTVIGVDLGTRNPTAILTCRYAGERFHVESEHYQRGMSSDEITDAAVAAWERTKAEYMLVDPSAAGLILSLQARGVRVRKATNDVMVGISTVTSVLPHMTVDPSCVNTIAEFESYQYPSGSAAGERDSPIKANDHCQDVIRYLCLELFGRPPKRWGMM